MTRESYSWAFQQAQVGSGFPTVALVTSLFYMPVSSIVQNASNMLLFSIPLFPLNVVVANSMVRLPSFVDELLD